MTFPKLQPELLQKTMALNNTKWNLLRYSLYAPFYNMVKPLFQQARRQSILRLGLNPGDKVLLVGCGTGLDLEFLPKDCEILGIDLSPAMVERSAKKAQKLGLNAKFLAMDAEKLDLETASFDAVILHLILAVVPKPEPTIKEVSRVLKEKGRLVIFDKFLADDQVASLGRRFVNGIVSFLFTDINRQLGPLLKAGRLKITTQEDSILRGAFKIFLVEPLKCF